jgi:hypothetical protein
MAMHVHVFVSATFIISLATFGADAAKRPAFADAVCLEQPERASPSGAHWYFHLDREKNRKCWHLGPAAAAVPPHEAPPFRMERTHTLTSSVETAFSSLFRGLRRLFRRPMPHEAQAGEPRIIQSDATRPLTMDDIAQQQPELPEDRAEVRPGAAGSLTSAQRKALFEDYLRWHELQRAGGTGGDTPARSP